MKTPLHFVALLLVAAATMRARAPARRYLSWVPPQYASLTLRQLLTHTSGIVVRAAASATHGQTIVHDPRPQSGNRHPMLV